MKFLFTNLKSTILILNLFALSFNLSAQNVGVNATGATPDISAMLDIATANKGLLIPRVALVSTTDAVTIATPATSLLVYNTNLTMTNGQGLGYYYNSGTTAAPFWIKLSSTAEAWLLRGNTGIVTPAIPATYGTSTIGTTENFLGTTDANDVVIGTNNIERFRVKQTTGYVGIGLANPYTKLNVSGGNWDVENGIGDFHVGNGTYRFKLGLATAGAGAGDVRMTSDGGTNRIFIGGGLNSEVITVDGTNQRVGIKNNINPASVLDIAGDIALREGPAIAVSSTYPVITLTAGAEFSHYRFTGASVPFWPYIINGGNDGQIITFINNTGQPMNVYNYPGFVNGIVTGTGNHLTSTSTSNSSFTVMYNATLQRWIVTAYTGMTDNNDNDWHITGNSGTNDPAAPTTYGTSIIANNENWIGTTDANDFTIGTNNIERMRVLQNSGNVGIGIATPSAKLHVQTVLVGQTAVYGENAYVGNSTAYGVYGVSNNNPGYGYGGSFYGGIRGVHGAATMTGTGNRYGGYFTGWYGAGANYGSYNYGYGGTTAYGVYGTTGGATTNIGGYFNGSGDYGVIVPSGGGLSGFGTTAPQQRLSVQESANIDQADANNGTTTNSLTFGSGSGEGIGSKRTAAGNQYGLDFYQGFTNRMRIWNDGNIVIGQNNFGNLAPYNSGLGNPSLTISNPSTISQTSDIPLFTARHYGTSGTTWQMGSIEYYTEGEANIGFTYQLCPLNSNTTTNLGASSNSKYLGYRWNQLFCSVAPNVSSDINLKKDIKPVDYGIHQLRKINPIAYKFKVDYAGTDKQIPDNEKRTHIGFNAQEVKQIIPEIVSSWDYITYNEDGYIKAKTPTLGMVYEEMIPVAVNAIKQLDNQQQQIIKTITISDFGMEQAKGNEIRVSYTKEFKDKLQGNPIVTITALEPNASYYIASMDADGFVIKNNNSTNSISFNWMAMAKINEQSFDIPSNYTQEQHAKKLKEIEAFEASLPSNEEALKMIKAKSDAKQQKQAPVLTPEQQKLKEEAEKLRIKTKELEKKFEAQNKEDEDERKRIDAETIKSNNTK